MTEPNEIHYKQRAQVKFEEFECSEVGLALVPQNLCRSCIGIPIQQQILQWSRFMQVPGKNDEEDVFFLRVS